MDAAVNQQLLNLGIGLVSLLSAMATYGISQLTTKVKAQTQQIKDEALRQQLNDAIDDVDELTTKTVGTIEQTTAKELRAAVKAGTAKKDDLIALSKQALDEITEQVRPEAQELIEDHFGDFADYLKKCIETKVLYIKSTEA